MHLPSEVVKRSIPEQRCPKLLFPWSIASLSLGFFYFCLFKISPGTWQVCWAFLQKRKLQSYSQANVCPRCGVCVRSHLFALCVMIHWDETLSGHFVMPLEMGLLIFFRNLESVIQSPNGTISDSADGLCFSILMLSQRSQLNDHKTIAQFKMFTSGVVMQSLLVVILYIKQPLFSGKARFQPVACGHKIWISQLKAYPNPSQVSWSFLVQSPTSFGSGLIQAQKCDVLGYPHYNIFMWNLFNFWKKWPVGAPRHRRQLQEKAVIF